MLRRVIIFYLIYSSQLCYQKDSVDICPYQISNIQDDKKYTIISFLIIIFFLHRNHWELLPETSRRLKGILMETCIETTTLISQNKNKPNQSNKPNQNEIQYFSCYLRCGWRRTTTSNQNLLPTGVEVCDGPNLDGISWNLDTRMIVLFQPQVNIRTVKLGNSTSLKMTLININPTGPYLLAFLPVDGHGAAFLDIWNGGQGNKDQYSVIPSPEEDKPYLYCYRKDQAETTGI